MTDLDPRTGAEQGWAREAAKPATPIEFAPVGAADLIHRYPEYRPATIEGLLREGEVLNVVAAPKTGKSWLVHSLAIACALGRPWLGFNTTGGRVLLIDGELHDQTLARRLATVAQTFGVEPAALGEHLHVWPVRGRGLTIDGLNSKLADVPKGSYRLVILDALYRFLPLGGEENSNETLTRVYNVVDELADRLWSAVTLVHHATKGSQATKAITDIGAGGGAQSRAADSHLVLRPHQEPGAVVVEAVVRSWKQPRPFVVRWADPGWNLAPELDPARLLMPKPRRTKTTPAAEKPIEPVRVRTVEEFAREFVGAAPSIREEIIARARATGLSKSQAEDYLRRAAADGNVHRLRSHTSPHRFTTETPSQSSLLAGGGDSGREPPPPESSTPGGMGGLARPPSPPVPSVRRRARRETKGDTP